MQTTRAIVLQAIRYGEADLIVKCFTEKNGLTSYLIRGVLKSKKGKLKSGFFQALTQLEIVAKHNEKSLSYIKEAKVLFPYSTLHTNIYKSSIALFLADSLRNAIQEEEENPNLYQYLETALQWLDSSESFANFHLLFLVKLTRHLGFYPNASAAPETPYFNLLDGDFQTSETNKYCISNENSKILKQLLVLDFDRLSDLKLNQDRRHQFLNMLMLYFELHLQGFKKPRSLDILHQLF